MEIQPSPTSSSATSSSSAQQQAAGGGNPMQSWWESISKARARIQSLASLLPAASAPLVSSLADSDRPSLSLLSSPDAYSALSLALSSSPASGSSHDPLCHWLYDTLLSPDPDLRLFPLSLLPLLASLYLSRLASPSPPLSGFEAVLLALYSAEAKARAGKPLLVSVPDLSLPSLYHTPSASAASPSSPRPRAPGVLCPPLEPHQAVKSTKRASIVAVALDCYHRSISLMPPHSKLDFCRFSASWAGQDCPCRHELDRPDAVREDCSSSSSSVSEIAPEDDAVAASMSRLVLSDAPGDAPPADEEGGRPVAARVPLPWELLQPVLRILGHCLLGPQNAGEVRDAAAVAVRAVYARAMHDIIPQAILASRSLIRLDRSTREAEKVAAAAAAAAAGSASNLNTPTKPRKPEILLVSK